MQNALQSSHPKALYVYSIILPGKSRERNEIALHWANFQLRKLSGVILTNFRINLEFLKFSKTIHHP